MDFNFYRNKCDGQGIDFLHKLYNRPIKATKIEIQSADVLTEMRERAEDLRAAIDTAEASQDDFSPEEYSVLENAKRQLFRLETAIHKTERFVKWGI